MDQHEIERVVRDVVRAALGARAARRARVRRVETAHIVQLWERGGSRRYTAVVDGPEALASAVGESREPFGTAKAGGYREDTLAQLPAGLRSRVEKVLASWGPSADLDVSHAVEPIAIVRVGRRDVVVTLGARRVACRRPCNPVVPTWLVIVPLALVVQFRLILAIVPSQAPGSDDLWLALVVASTLLLLGGAVATGRRLGATERSGLGAD